MENNKEEDEDYTVSIKPEFDFRKQYSYSMLPTDDKNWFFIECRIGSMAYIIQVNRHFLIGKYNVIKKALDYLLKNGPTESVKLTHSPIEKLRDLVFIHGN